MLVNFAVAIGLYYLSYSLWVRLIIAVGFESLTAVLSILSLAAIITLNKDSKKSYIVLCVAFAYYAIMEIGGAIEKLFLTISPIEQKTSYVLASDIFALVAVGTFILAAILLELKEHTEPATRSFHIHVWVFFLVILTGQGLGRFAIYPLLNVETIALLSSVLMIVGVSIFLIISILLVQKHRVFDYVGTLRTTGAAILLMASIIVSWISIYTGSPIWILSNCLQIVAFFSFYIGFIVPFLRANNSHETKNGEIFGYSGAFMIISLLFVTMITELIWPGIEFIDFGVSTVVTIGSTAMLITITVFTFNYIEKTKLKFLYPLLFVYSLWISTGLVQLASYFLFSYPLVDSLIPYIITSLLSIPAFLLSYKWIRKMEDDSQNSIVTPANSVIFGLVSGVVTITMGEVINFFFFSSGETGSPIGRSLLLALCLVAVSELFLISFLRYEITEGTVTLDALSIAFLSIWFIPSLLKGNFTTWTVGWWIGEAVILLGLLIAPAIMGTMYLESSFRAKQSEARAKVYADLMAHDISNHHQIVMSTIELALMDSTPEISRKKTLTSALQTLTDADHLIKNVRKLGSLEVLTKKDLFPCDLVTALSDTFYMMRKIYPEQTVNFIIDKPLKECQILANDLLPDIFQNLLFNAIKYSNGSEVKVGIRRLDNMAGTHWEVHVTDFGPGIPPDKRKDIFTRYLRGARGSGLGLSLVQALTELFDGTIRIEDRIPGDYKKGSSFIITFPAFST